MAWPLPVAGNRKDAPTDTIPTYDWKLTTGNCRAWPRYGKARYDAVERKAFS